MRSSNLTLALLGSALALVACGGEIGPMPIVPGGDAGVRVGDALWLETEICGNQIDDNGDGHVDENCACDPALTPTQACYPGPAATREVGICKAGVQTCISNGDTEFAHWGPCTGAVLPQPEICDDGIDNDCSGQADDGYGCGKGDNGGNGGGSGNGDAGAGGSGGNGGSGGSGGNGGVDAGGGSGNTGPDCGAHNCFGCCDPGGVCRAPSAAFCGVKGQPCRSCGGGQCLPAFGVCDNDPVDIYLVSFKVDQNADCGPFDNCDPYAKITFGTHKTETSTGSGHSINRNDKLLTVTRRELTQLSMRMEFFDKDSGLHIEDESLGQCAFGFPLSALDVGSWMTNCNALVYELKFSFTVRNY